MVRWPAGERDGWSGNGSSSRGELGDSRDVPSSILGSPLLLFAIVTHCVSAPHVFQDWRILQSYADTVDDAFREQYGLLKSTTRYMTEWTLSEVLALMHRYLQVGPVAFFCVIFLGGTALPIGRRNSDDMVLRTNGIPACSTLIRTRFARGYRHGR